MSIPKESISKINLFDGRVIDLPKAPAGHEIDGDSLDLGEWLKWTVSAEAEQTYPFKIVARRSYVDNGWQYTGFFFVIYTDGTFSSMLFPRIETQARSAKEAKEALIAQLEANEYTSKPSQA